MAWLRSDGIRFAIDDFGTGYSSLKYLRSFPADKLKVAQEFVSGAPEDRNDTAIVRATIDLAKDMEMTVIAEGAETAAQVEFLRALRCDQVQGYYFSRPLDIDQATAFLKNDRIRRSPGTSSDRPDCDLRRHSRVWRGALRVVAAAAIGDDSRLPGMGLGRRSTGVH